MYQAEICYQCFAPWRTQPLGDKTSGGAGGSHGSSKVAVDSECYTSQHDVLVSAIPSIHGA
jgi:hypothetical protein